MQTHYDRAPHDVLNDVNDLVLDLRRNCGEGQSIATTMPGAPPGAHEVSFSILGQLVIMHSMTETEDWVRAMHHSNFDVVFQIVDTGSKPAQKIGFPETPQQVRESGTD